MGLIGLADSGIAQVDSKVVPPPRTVKARSQTTGEDQRMIVARRLVNNRDYENAANLLEAINDSLPDNTVVETLLLRCYENLGHYVKGETLARKMLKANPGQVTFALKLAELLAKQEKTNEAGEVYSQTLAMMGSNDTNGLTRVITSMLNNGVDSLTYHLIDSLRHQRAEVSLFGLEKGQALEKQKKYREAVREYNAVLAVDTTRLAMQAEKRLLELLAFVETEPLVIEILTTADNFSDNQRAIRLLTSHFIRTGQYDRAFEFSLKQDSTENLNSRALMFFMRQCSERQKSRQVIRMGEYILGENRPGFSTLNTYRLLGEAYAATEQFQKALAVNSKLIDLTPEAAQKAEVLASNGYIYLYGLSDCDSALICFDSVVLQYPQGFGFVNALRGVPLAQLGKGELETSRRAFIALNRRHLNPDLKEEIAYYLASLDFFEHRFDSATTGLRKLMIDYPRGLYVNDALELLMVMTEAEEDTSRLIDYAAAWLYEIRREIDQARRQWEKMTTDNNSALADNALYRGIKLDLMRGDTLQAEDHLKQLQDDFPDSYYLPWALHTRGDLALTSKEGRTQARECYRQLLEDFPNYPFVSEIREKLRDLEATELVDPVG